MGFGLLGVSYVLKDVFKLRVCIAISNVFLILWGVFALPKESCICAASWNGLFLLINVYRAYWLWKTANDAKNAKDGHTKIDTKEIDVEITVTDPSPSPSPSPSNRLLGLGLSNL